MPTLAVFFALLLLFVTFHPAELETKLRAAALVGVVAVVSSLIGLRAKGRAPSRQQLFDAAEQRQGTDLPPVSRIDLERPLLGIGPAADGRFVMFLLFVEDREVVVALPAVVRGRAPKSVGYESVSEARESLRSLGVKVLPQSDFTDATSREIFGDWKDLRD